MRRNEDYSVPVILKIENLYSNIDAVKDRSYGIREHLKYDYYQHLNRLNDKKLQLERKLEEFKNSTSGTYDQIKDGVEDKIYELSLVIQEIKERFQE